MKVRELLKQLGNCDPDLDVICWREDGTLQANGQAFQLLDIDRVNLIEGERVRLDDGTPYIKLGKTPESIVLAVLEVTGDF